MFACSVIITAYNNILSSEVVLVLIATLSPASVIIEQGLATYNNNNYYVSNHNQLL